MSFLDVGIDIKAHNADALRGIAAVKLALMGLRKEQGISAQRTKELSKQNAALNQALHHQSRALKGLTLQWGQLRRLTLTFAFRSAVLGITALVSSLNSLAAASGAAVVSLSNLGAASVLGGLQGLTAFGQGLAVLTFGLKDLAKAYYTFGTIHATTMKKLSKPAREFYDQTRELRRGIKELKVLSQQGMFPGLLKAFEHLKVLGPIVAQTVYDTATSIGYLADRAGEMAEKRAPMLERMLNRNTLTLQRMGVATEDLVAGIMTFFDEGGPLLDHMSGQIVKFASNAKKSLHEWAEDGSLQKFFKNLRKSWDNWTAIMGAVFKGLFGFWTAMQPVAHKVENAIEGAAKKFAAWSSDTENQDKITKFFKQSLKPMGAFLHLVGDIGKLWVHWAKQGNDDAVRFFNGLDKNLLPILQELGDYFDSTLLPRVGDLADAFLDFVHTVIPSIKNFLTILTPIGKTIEGVLRLAADLVEMFQDLGPASGVIGSLMVGAAIISSWHKLKTAVSLTLMTARAGMGVEGAVMPRRQAFRQVIPGLGFAAASRSLVSNARQVPGYVNDRYRESVDRGAERAGVVSPYATPVGPRAPRYATIPQRMRNSGLVAPNGYLLDRQLTQVPGGGGGGVRQSVRAVSPGGVILPSSSVATMESQIAKGSKSGLLRGLKSAAMGLAGTGIPQAIGLSIALIAGPAIVSAGINLVKDKRPKVQQEIGDLGGDLRKGMGGDATAFNDKRLKGINDELGEFIRQGNSSGMRGIAEKLRDIAKATEDVGKKKGLEKAIADVRLLAVQTDTALLGKTAPAFEEFAKRGDKSISGILDGLSVLQVKIYDEIPNTDAPAYRDAMASSFHAAALAVKAGMDAGLISIKKGTKEYTKLLREQFRTLGFTPQQVKNLVATGGVDPTGKKGGSENPGGVKVDYGPQNPTTNSGSGPKLRAIGGGFYLGSKGERGQDNIPMQVAGQNIMAGRGEYVGIFNAQQQKAFSGMAQSFGYGGMEGFFQSNSRPHYMAGGGIVALGNRLQKMGYSVGEQSHFGGVHPVHVPGSYHYKDQALDINDDFAPFVSGNNEMSSLDHLAAILGREGWHYLWRVKNHFDHLHVDTASGVGGLSGLGSVGKMLKRIIVPGSGMVKGLAQGVLDRFRQGANSAISMANDSVGGGGFEGEGIPSGGSGGAGANMALAKSMLGQFGWGADQWPALKSLGMGESGWITDRTNSSSGAFGIGQFLGSTGTEYAKYGALTHGNAAAQINAMLHYIKDRYGSPSKAYGTWLSHSPHWYSGGGIVKATAGFLGGPPPIGQGYPDVNPDDANVPGGDSKKKKKKKKTDAEKRAAAKKKHMEQMPGLGQGYSRADFAKKNKLKTHARKFVRKLIDKQFLSPNASRTDPLTGEVSSTYEKSFNQLEKFLGGWNTDVGVLTGQYNDAEDATPGSGFSLLGQILGIHEDRPFSYNMPPNRFLPNMIQKVSGKGILGLLQSELGLVGGIPAGKGVSEARGRLTQYKKVILANIRIRDSYAKKLRHIRGGGTGWKGAVSHNEDIIREWQRWKRDSDEDPAGRRKADSEIDRLQDENRWLSDHKPPRLTTGTKQYRESLRVYDQRGIENRLLTGDANVAGWDPNAATPNSAVGKAMDQLTFWSNLKDFKTSNYNPLRQAVQDEVGEVARLRRQIGLGPTGGAPVTNASDDILKQIGEAALRDQYRSGLNFGALSDFAQRLGMRSIGAFAHGGPVRETGMALLHRGEYVMPSPDGPFRQGMNAPVSVNSAPQITLVLKDRAGSLIELVDARIDGRSAGVTNQQVGRSSRQISVAPGRPR